MYKSINMHKNTDEHEFASLEDALAYFRLTWSKVTILDKYPVTYGLTRGEHTQVLDNITIGLWSNSLDADAPDEVIILQNQTPRDYPLENK